MKNGTDWGAGCLLPWLCVSVTLRDCTDIFVHVVACDCAKRYVWHYLPEYV